MFSQITGGTSRRPNVEAKIHGLSYTMKIPEARIYMNKIERILGKNLNEIFSNK
jgi:hypothetical protein